MNNVLAPDKNTRYDLPFHAKVGTEFLVFLTALMTLLCLLSVTASLSLSQLANKWTSGLENTLTVEIPYSSDQSKTAEKILDALKNAEGIRSAKLMEQDEMKDILSPWLGDAAESLNGLPLPALITVEMKERNGLIMKRMRQMITAIAPEAQVDAHEQWLTDLLRLTKALNVASLLILIGIGLVTSLTVAGAVRSRMAIHHTELEILHIIGASDTYIAGQFQKYIGALTGRGVLLGLIISVALTGGLHMMSQASADTLPGAKMTILQFLALPFTAALLFALSLTVARYTTLRVLREMP